MGTFNGEWVHTGTYYHHHNGDTLCFPNQNAEVDEDNPHRNYVLPEPEPQVEYQR